MSSPIKITGVLIVPFRGKIIKLVPLMVLKPKMTATRVVAIPFRGLYLKNDKNCNCICYVNNFYF